jgi:hypothetical protein
VNACTFVCQAHERRDWLCHTGRTFGSRECGQQSSSTRHTIESGLVNNMLEPPYTGQCHCSLFRLPNNLPQPSNICRLTRNCQDTLILTEHLHTSAQLSTLRRSVPEMSDSYGRRDSRKDTDRRSQDRRPSRRRFDTPPPPHTPGSSRRPPSTPPRQSSSYFGGMRSSSPDHYTSGPAGLASRPSGPHPQPNAPGSRPPMPQRSLTGA